MEKNNNFDNKNKYVNQSYNNITSNEITVLEVILENILIKYQKNLSLKQSIFTPISMIISIIVVLVTANFKNDIIGGPGFWNSFFILALIAFIIWLFIIGYYLFINRGQLSISFIISKIKNETTDISNNNTTKRNKSTDSPKPLIQNVIDDIPLLSKPINEENLNMYSNLRFTNLKINVELQNKLLGQLERSKKYRTLNDINDVIEKAKFAVSKYKDEHPHLFKDSTDFITKSLGFIDENFRIIHTFGKETDAAFIKYAHLINYQEPCVKLINFSKTSNFKRFDHFYTLNADEMINSRNQFGYQLEGIQCWVSAFEIPSSKPLYRLHNRESSDHFYTTNELKKNSYLNIKHSIDEGNEGYVYTEMVIGFSPLYQLRHPKSNDHFYTTSEIEKNIAKDKYEYEYEGICCYVSLKNGEGLSPLFRSFKDFT